MSFFVQELLFLYEQGCQAVGHIQSGNIFVEGDVCMLGGYENMLLGYRTRLYNLCNTFSCVEDIDTVMFGKKSLLCHFSLRGYDYLKFQDI